MLSSAFHQSNRFLQEGISLLFWFSVVLMYLNTCMCVFLVTLGIKEKQERAERSNDSFMDGSEPEGCWRESGFRQTHISELATAAEELLNTACRIAHLSVRTCTRTKHKNIRLVKIIPTRLTTLYMLINEPCVRLFALERVNLCF